MKLIIIFFSLFSLSLNALVQIEQRYLINTHTINSSLFFKDQDNHVLYEIPSHKYTLRIKKKQLEKLLKDHQFKDFNIRSRYVHFEVKSPIDTSKIELFLKQHYQEKYTNISFKSITVEPRSYMQKLPQEYTFSIRPRNHLSKKGILSIEDNFHKKYFFNYTIEAEIIALVANKSINREEELSRKNTKLKKITLTKFRALPLQKVYLSTYEAKHKIKQNTLLTQRDVNTLSLVKKDTLVSVWLNSAGISISFAAKASQSGKLNDIISVQKSDGKRLKVKVIGKQKVQMK